MAETFTAERRREFVDHLAHGMMRGAAAYVIGVKRATVDGYIAEHDDFAMEVAEAEQTATEHVHEAVYQAAVTGDVRAAKLWLEIRGHSRRRGNAPVPDPPADTETESLMQELDP